MGIHSIIRKHERFMMSISGNYHNNCTEVRPDTKGASADEITNYPQRNSIDEDDVIGIGRFFYRNETEKFFRYKSRGRK